MTATEKPNIVLKQVITPFLRQAGFKKSGLSWWIELKDCFLIIRMQNSRFNTIATGINAEFQFSASAKDDIRGKLTDHWTYNQAASIEEYYFLPQFGLLGPFRAKNSPWPKFNSCNYVLAATKEVFNWRSTYRSTVQ